MIKVSAPGKVHLIGEYSVLYGEPAIIAAIDKRCYIEAEKSDKVIITSRELEKTFTFQLQEIQDFTAELTKLWDECYTKKDFSKLFSKMNENLLVNHVKIAVGKTLERLGIKAGISFEIKSDIPIGAGVGSGAALAVAIVNAVSDLYGKKLTLEEVNGIAFEIEKFAHGTPSGGDNSACCYGGLIWFQKTSAIKSLKEEIPYKLENFVLVNTTKTKKATGELVQLVKNLDESFRNGRIEKISKLTYEMREVLKNKNFIRMRDIINEVHKNLAELGVSTIELDELAFAVREIGGAAKLCGAGGGGMMLCYHENKNKLLNAIKGLGYTPIETQLGVDGVRSE